MSAWLLVILAILLLAGLFWWRQQTTKTVVSASPKSPGRSFHGVSIRLDRRHAHIDIETQRSGKEHREHDDRRQGRR